VSAGALFEPAFLSTPPTVSCEILPHGTPKRHHRCPLFSVKLHVDEHSIWPFEDLVGKDFRMITALSVLDLMASGTFGEIAPKRNFR